MPMPMAMDIADPQIVAFVPNNTHITADITDAKVTNRAPVPPNLGYSAVIHAPKMPPLPNNPGIWITIRDHVNDNVERGHTQNSVNKF